ncbi:single-stranded DNA-binding protein (plasmid) [Bacillus licheniformis]|uniref:Single-stranded DNA-binding protein n=1 Tax=Bacillus licheniformis TaxID=1402 RepID=A0AB37H1W2_BACLI|nr:single-stranded DNA-binding protein [Bacillus licheniformis]QPR75142.1 single-stranded DNA-binding protein [Bacillus licheniformis]
MNNVSLVGRLTRDPELKYTPGGNPVVNFTLAVNRTLPTSKASDKPTLSTVRRGIKRRKHRELSAERVFDRVSGRLQTSSYEKDGTRFYKTEVVVETAEFLEPKNKNSGGSQSTRGESREPTGSVPDVDDDLPF